MNDKTNPEDNSVTEIKKIQLYAMAIMAIISPVVTVTVFAMNTNFAIEKQGILMAAQFEKNAEKEDAELRKQSDLNFMFEKRLTSLEVEDKTKFTKIDNFLVRVSEKLIIKY